jgi:hypothetical protein
MAFAIFDGKIFLPLIFLPVVYGKDAGKKIGGKNMKKVRKIKASGICDLRW